MLQFSGAVYMQVGRVLRCKWALYSFCFFRYIYIYMIVIYIYIYITIARR
jgi:hypothetical protein